MVLFKEKLGNKTFNTPVLFINLKAKLAPSLESIILNSLHILSLLSFFTKSLVSLIVFKVLKLTRLFCKGYLLRKRKNLKIRR